MDDERKTLGNSAQSESGDVLPLEIVRYPQGQMPIDLYNRLKSEGPDYDPYTILPTINAGDMAVFELRGQDCLIHVILETARYAVTTELHVWYIAGKGLMQNAESVILFFEQVARRVGADKITAKTTKPGMRRFFAKCGAKLEETKHSLDLRSIH